MDCNTLSLKFKDTHVGVFLFKRAPLKTAFGEWIPSLNIIIIIIIIVVVVVVIIIIIIIILCQFDSLNYSN